MTDVAAEFPEVSDTLPGAFYNDTELEFIRDHIGETPYKALKEFDMSDSGLRRDTITYMNRGRTVPHVNDEIESFTNTVKPVLERVFNLMDTEDPDFVGIESIKQGINKALRYSEAYRAEKARDANGQGWHPSMYAKDANGNRYYQGRTSDSGYLAILNIPILKQAVVSKRDFTVDIMAEYEAAAGGLQTENALAEPPRDFTQGILDTPTDLIETKNTWQCPIADCGHSDTFKLESPSSRAAARLRTLKHMLATKDEVEPHREAHAVISRL